MSIIKTTITIIEYLLFGILGLFTFLGYSDGLFASIPFINQINGIPILLILSFYAFRFSVNSEYRVSGVATFGLSILTLTILHLSMNSETGSEPILNSPLLFITIIGTGIFGSVYHWVIPFILFVAGDLFYSTYSLLLTDLNQGIQQIITLFRTNVMSYIYLLTVGIISSLTHLRKSILNMSNVISPEVTESVKSNLPDTTFLQDATPRNNTQFVPIEYSTGVIQNQKDNVKEVLSSVVYFMCRNFKSYSALGFIFDPSTQMFILNSYHSKSLNIIKEVRIPLGTGVVGKIGTERRSFISGDYSFYSPELLYYREHEEINSILAVPIISEKNELLGTLVIDSTDKNTFKEQDKEILKRFSSLAAALITNTRTRIFQERAALTFSIFYEASHRFTTALNIDDVFNVLFEIVPMITPCFRQMAITYSEIEKTGIVYRIHGNDNNNEIPTGFKFVLNNGLYSFVLKNRKLVNVPDFIQYENKYYRFVPEEPKNQNIRSLIIFPLLDDESRCRGLFSIESSQPNQFHEELEQILSTLIENTSVAFTRALLYKKMEKLATTDGLTELNNHRQFQELLTQELERSRRYNRTVSLLLLDIDHFKSFNDTYGHPVGDLVLKEISSCIRQSIRSNDIPARYGGEEFAVILPETVEKGCITIAERIRVSIEKHVIHSLDRQLKVSVSIGCASFSAKKISQKELIDRADKALYFSKEHGRNKVSLYSDGMVKYLKSI